MRTPRLQAEGGDAPWKSLPTFRTNRCSHLSSPVVFRAATTAASMAMDGPERSATHRLRAERREDIGTFLPREEWASAQGKSLIDGVAARRRGAAGLRPDQAIKEARCVRVLNNNRGRKWRLSVRLDKRSERFGAGKETVGGKSGIVSAKSQPQARGLPQRV